MPRMAPLTLQVPVSPRRLLLLPRSNFKGRGDQLYSVPSSSCHFSLGTMVRGGSVAEWLACWTQAQKARVQIAGATLSGNSLKQTIHTHRAPITKQQNW